MAPGEGDTETRWARDRSFATPAAPPERRSVQRFQRAAGAGRLGVRFAQRKEEEALAEVRRRGLEVRPVLGGEREAPRALDDALGEEAPGRAERLGCAGGVSGLSIAARLAWTTRVPSMLGAVMKAGSFAPGAMPSSFLAARTLPVSAISQSTSALAAPSTLASGRGHWARIRS